MEYSVLGLIEVGVPALSEIIHVLIRVGVWDLLLWRIVVEDLLGLFLGGDHAFDFVEYVLVDVDEGWPLVRLLDLGGVTTTGTFLLHTLSFLDEGLGVHFVQDGRDAGSRLAKSFEALNVQVVIPTLFLLDDALAPVLLVRASRLLLLFRVQDSIDTQESAVLLTVH